MEWQPTSVFLPGKPHGQRSLVGYSSWGHKKSDMTERLSQTQKENMGSLELENSLCYSGGPCWLSVLYVKVLVAHLCLTLCDPMNCSPPGSSVHGISQARILEWVAICFFGGLPTQGSNPNFLHYRQILYHLSHQGSSKDFIFLKYPRQA